MVLDKEDGRWRAEVRRRAPPALPRGAREHTRGAQARTCRAGLGLRGAGGGAARGLGPGGGGGGGGRGEDRGGLGRRAGSQSRCAGPLGRAAGGRASCARARGSGSPELSAQRRRFVQSISSLRLLLSPQPSPSRRRVTREVPSAGQISGFWKIGLPGLRRAALGEDGARPGVPGRRGEGGLDPRGDSSPQV